MGDVVRKTEKFPDQKLSFLIPSTKGSEVSGMYETVIQSLAGDRHPCVSIQNPFVEDIIVNKTFERDFFLVILAGDIIMAASPHSRKDLLISVLGLIQDNSLSEDDLFRF